jgi:ABC-2 type transport system ATP-binding protein
MKVGEQAIYLAMLKGLSREESIRRLQYWFDTFDISSWWNRRLEELSKGMQQKVQFIITVLHRPRLLILDEPFSGFDPVNAERLKQEILQLRDAGTTVVFSTHNMASVEEICDHIALINHSKVVLNGPVDTIKERFREGRFEVVATRGRLPETSDAYHLLSQNTVAGRTVYRLTKAEGVSTSALLGVIARHVEVRAFSEMMPSMQEIFLKVVGADEAPSSTSVSHE